MVSSLGKWTRFLPAVVLLVTPALRAEWQPVGPFGGEADFIASSPVQHDFLISGSRNGLLYESTDGGASWKHIFFPRQLSGVVHALQLDPRSSTTWYVGVEDQVASLSGLYRTTDGGKTWTSLPGLKGMAVWSLVMWPADPSVMAAGTADGVYFSEDNAETWRRISPEGDKELQPVVSLAFHPSDRRTLYAGTTHLPWRTTDGGATWTSIHEGMLDDSDVFSITPDPRAPDDVLASACSGAYRSYNGGKLWARLPTPIGAFRVYLVTRDPQHPGVYFAATTSGLMRSVNKGMAWTKVSPAIVKSMAFDSGSGDRVFAASVTAGILISNDGGVTFHESNRGFADHNLTSLIGAEGVLYSASIYEGDAGGIFRSDDSGRTWRLMAGREALAGENLRFVRATPGQPNLLFAAGLRGLLRSLDGGKTWARIPAPGDGTIRALHVLPGATPVLFAGTSAGLFRSKDRGQTWTAAPFDPAHPRQAIQWIQGSGDLGVAIGTGQGAYLSSDGGGSWVTCAPPLAEAQWYGLAGGSGPTAVALAATSHGLFRSADGCRSWEPASTGSSGTAPLVLSHPTRTGVFLAVQNGRVLLSSDAGVHWQPAVNEEQTASFPAALVVLPAMPDDLFVLLPRRGVFRIAPAQTDLAAQ